MGGASGADVYVNGRWTSSVPNAKPRRPERLDTISNRSSRLERLATLGEHAAHNDVLKLADSLTEESPSDPSSMPFKSRSSIGQGRFAPFSLPVSDDFETPTTSHFETPRHKSRRNDSWLALLDY